MSTVTYRVDGMTCGHCAQSVSREVGALAGVTEVAVDLEAHTVAVTGPATESDVAAAVAEAGYTARGAVS
ncbi:heavy-metal-associated domain-containing protein [Microbacterium elymi]|uniref:Heavy-metal-associated domain-containing protein n=1 Tax=Microbacterium elymi TaxID=2909587 RepID=A0ABY5NIX3_9MICO|nr:heavy-metal-associated domain-containing protein [Microbacterium elymi]UUT35079.1 heavy-metal-associated domain-containing protein [Microbacterium elymi]